MSGGRVRVCETCMFHSVMKRECRRHAPLPMPAAVELQGVFGASKEAVWPKVKPRDYCGDWKSKPETG